MSHTVYKLLIEPILNRPYSEVKLQTESFMLSKKLMVGANLFA